MKIIKINATESSNLFLKNLDKNLALKEITAVKALKQTKGRGQRGTTWQSEDNKNLIVSYLLPEINLTPDNGFMISILTSLAVKKCLERLNIPDLTIKWPNDILSCHYKVAGILIENSFSAHQIKNSIIGIGLNVNQTSFHDLPKASSLSLLTNQNYDIDKVFDLLNTEIEKIYDILLQKNFNSCLNSYYDSLLGFQENQIFNFPDGSQKEGIITSVEKNGFLNVKFKDTTQSFDLKEIKQVY